MMFVWNLDLTNVLYSLSIHQGKIQKPVYPSLGEIMPLDKGEFINTLGCLKVMSLTLLK